MTELLIAEAAGIKGENIIFSSNNTPLAYDDYNRTMFLLDLALREYHKAKQLGSLINLDDISHIEFIKEKIGMPDIICFRLDKKCFLW